MWNFYEMREHNKEHNVEIVPKLKEEFINKFKVIINENFKRAFTLVKNTYTTAESNGMFDKEI